jgi:hypothetical protein
MMKLTRLNGTRLWVSWRAVASVEEVRRNHHGCNSVIYLDGRKDGIECQEFVEDVMKEYAHAKDQSVKDQDVAPVP